MVRVISNFSTIHLLSQDILLILDISEMQFLNLVINHIIYISIYI